ncbi:2-dehydro-3-deoxygalactonokinase [Nioella aestuarii]|uniref:2-dehydro-3-deoxygalactonokinase n=1 Tax=Nioella aestuarii TaxID=1662864 RepID=UPI003D7FBCF1
MTRADWIAVDWGTSHLRAWAISASGAVLDKAASADGMGGLSQAEFEPALLRLINPWLNDQPTPVIACGMVGAKQGWVEAPYRTVPCKPGEAAPIMPATRDSRIKLHILPGVSQDSPADVMRGEETQTAGVIHENPHFDGILCLPGTHTKWIHISAEEIVSFRTAMTGELFALLSQHSVLRHSVGGQEFDRETFDVAVAETLSRPERLAQSLFTIRAEGLLHGQSNAAAKGRLSGLLIGAELAAARPYWLGQQVLIGGAPALVALYARALETQGVHCLTRDAETLTLAGLRLAHAKLTEAP